MVRSLLRVPRAPSHRRCRPRTRTMSPWRTRYESPGSPICSPRATRHWADSTSNRNVTCHGMAWTRLPVNRDGIAARKQKPSQYPDNVVLFVQWSYYSYAYTDAAPNNHFVPDLLDHWWRCVVFSKCAHCQALRRRSCNTRSSNCCVYLCRLQMQSTVVEHKDGGTSGGIFKSYTILKVSAPLSSPTLSWRWVLRCTRSLGSRWNYILSYPLLSWKMHWPKLTYPQLSIPRI